MFLRKAMRYYRLWIYTCNAVLFVSVAVLVVVATKTASSPLTPLLPGPPAYDPTYLYAYLAIILQAGIVQSIGCIGAIKLSQRVLHIYWLSLVLLLVGDIIVGLVWFLRFPRLSTGITAKMNASLQDYGYDDSSTKAWDSLQRTGKCCGVGCSEDYHSSRWAVQQGVLPLSCCVPRRTDQSTKVVPSDLPKKDSERHTCNKTMQCIRGQESYDIGCEDYLKTWMHSSAETLMIIGFCIITFVKLCFVGILKFEIKEMIEKIRVLQGDSANTPDPELAAALGLVLPGAHGNDDFLHEGPDTSGGDATGASNSDAAVEETITAQDSRLLNNGKNSIGIKDNNFLTGKPLKPPDSPDSSPFPSHASIRPSIFGNCNEATLADTGGDSDTNSHSALITNTPVRRVRPPELQTIFLPPPPPPSEKIRHNGNNNDLCGTPLHEGLPLHTFYHVRQTQI